MFPKRDAVKKLVLRRTCIWLACAILFGVPWIAEAATLEIEVNYAWDVVYGITSPDQWVTVEGWVYGPDGILKGDFVIRAEDSGDFYVRCFDWLAGECPDISPNDKLVVSADSVTRTIDPIGEITATLDEAENTVSGTVHAGSLTSPISMRCEVWKDPGPSPIEQLVNPQGGSYTCDFDDVGWDLKKGEIVAISYSQPDGDSVINISTWPLGYVDYGQDSVGGDYPAHHSIKVIVSDSQGVEKAEATATSQLSAGRNGDGFTVSPHQWSPAIPNIVAGDFVKFLADDGYENLIQVGTITGQLDLNLDLITGTINAKDFLTEPELAIECFPLRAWEIGLNDIEILKSSAGPGGDPPYTCDWTKWDILPGQTVGVTYVEPDFDRVSNIFYHQLPDMSVRQWVNGRTSVVPQSRVVYNIELENRGDAEADSVTLVDTLPEGVTYVFDNSGIEPTLSGNQIIWEYGAILPGVTDSFQMAVDVSNGIPGLLINTVEILSPKDVTLYNNIDKSYIELSENPRKK